jgi:hypothetical protein
VPHISHKVAAQCDDARAAPARALVADVEHEVQQRLHGGARHQSRLRAPNQPHARRFLRPLTSNPNKTTTFNPDSITRDTENHKKTTSQVMSTPMSAAKRNRLKVDINATCAI